MSSVTLALLCSMTATESTIGKVEESSTEISPSTTGDVLLLSEVTHIRVASRYTTGSTNPHNGRSRGQSQQEDCPI